MMIENNEREDNQDIIPPSRKYTGDMMSPSGNQTFADLNGVDQIYNGINPTQHHTTDEDESSQEDDSARGGGNDQLVTTQTDEEVADRDVQMIVLKGNSSQQKSRQKNHLNLNSQTEDKFSATAI